MYRGKNWDILNHREPTLGFLMRSGIGEQMMSHQKQSKYSLFNEKLPKEAGQYCRIFQDSQERFYLLGSSGLLYPMDQERQSLGDPMKLDFQGHELLHSEVKGMYGLS